MNITDNFHPDDVRAHGIIQHVCGIDPAGQMTNKRAVRQLMARLIDERNVLPISDEDDKFLCEWIREIMK